MTTDRRPNHDPDDAKPTPQDQAEAKAAERQHEQEVRARHEADERARRRAALTPEQRAKEDAEEANKAAEQRAKVDAKLNAYLTPFAPQINALHPFEELNSETVCELIVGNILYGPTSLANLRAFAELVTAPPPPAP